MDHLDFGVISDKASLSLQRLVDFVVAVLYLGVNLALSRLVRMLERRAASGARSEARRIFADAGF